jgi:hypothetical protein
MTPSEELLSAYLDDELGAQERADVERRLASDSHWRETLEKLQEVRAWMHELPVVVPSRPKSIVQMLAEHKPDSTVESTVHLSNGSNISDAPTSWKWMMSLAATSLLLVGTTLWWTSGMNYPVALGPSLERSASDLPPPAARNIGGAIPMRTSDSETSVAENAASGEAFYGDTKPGENAVDAPMGASLAPAMASKSMPAPGSAIGDPATPVPVAEPPTDPAPAMLALGEAGAPDAAQDEPSSVDAMNVPAPGGSGEGLVGGSGGFGGFGGTSGGLAGGLAGGGSGTLPKPESMARSFDEKSKLAEAGGDLPTAGMGSPPPSLGPGGRSGIAEEADSGTPTDALDQQEDKDRDASGSIQLGMNTPLRSISRFMTEKTNTPKSEMYFLAEEFAAETGAVNGLESSELKNSQSQEFLLRRADQGLNNKPTAVDVAPSDLKSLNATSQGSPLFQSIMDPVVHLMVPAEALADLEETITTGELKLQRNATPAPNAIAKNDDAETKAGETQTRSANGAEEVWLLEISAANYEALRARWSEKGFDVTEILDDQKLNVVRVITEDGNDSPNVDGELELQRPQAKSANPARIDSAPRANPPTPLSDFIFILLQRR